MDKISNDGMELVKGSSLQFILVILVNESCKKVYTAIIMDKISNDRMELVKRSSLQFILVILVNESCKKVYTAINKFINTADLKLVKSFLLQ